MKNIEVVEDNIGVMASINPGGKLIITTWKLPIDQRASLWGWVEDFFHVIEEFSFVRLWLLERVLGRYGYREMVGMLEDLKKRGEWVSGFGYNLEDVEYHKDGKRLNFKYD